MYILANRKYNMLMKADTIRDGSIIKEIIISHYSYSCCFKTSFLL